MDGGDSLVEQLQKRAEARRARPVETEFRLWEAALRAAIVRSENFDRDLKFELWQE